MSTSIALIITISQLLYDYYQDIQRIESTLQQIKTANVPSLAVSIWEVNDEQIIIQTKSLLNIPEVERVEILQLNRDTISQGTIPLDAKNYIKAYTFKLEFKDVNKKETTPLGELKIYYNFKTIYSRLLKKLALIFFSNFAKTLIVSFTILFIFWRLVTKHIVSISNQLNQYEEVFDQKLTISLNHQENLGEINELIMTINKLCSYVSELKSDSRSSETSEALTNEYYLLFNTKQNFVTGLISAINEALIKALKDLSELTSIVEKINQKDIKHEDTNNYIQQLIENIETFKHKYSQFSTLSNRIKLVYPHSITNKQLYYKSDLIDLCNKVSSFIKKNDLIIDDQIVFSANIESFKIALQIIFSLINDIDNPQLIQTRISKQSMNMHIVISYVLVHKPDDSNQTLLNKIDFAISAIDTYIKSQLQGHFYRELVGESQVKWVINFPSQV
ncbi:hypothetical protein [Spartinivicinus ruber]|uniref:hypothetical protein n=1 Tax=Spartinivicinus ruber TaxID=2683272 RepID=UPI0013CF8489|nr:hypothetical protein [Spartinivicinus ruber]